LIGLTGHAEAAVRQQALAAGFDRFELKPWNIDTMRAVLTVPETVRRRTVT
jgi:CheY-like chemotaxis protein